MAANYWMFYKQGIIANVPPYQAITVDKKSLFRQSKSAFYIRWDSDFDKCSNKSYYHVIRDGEFTIDTLPSKTRNMVRKCLRNCQIRRVNSQYIIDGGGYDVYVSESARYKRNGHPTFEKSQERWAEGMLAAESNGQECWAVLYENKIIAYSLCWRKERHVDLVTWKVDYDGYNQFYPSYGLVYQMCEYYLNQEAVQYVNDGGRSLTQHSNVQDFLIDRFGFRKAYTKLNAIFRWYLVLPLIMLSIFEGCIKSNKVRSLVRLYKWSR